MVKPPKELIDIFKKTNGAMSVTEMFALYNIVLDAPHGVYCELGVAYGKSATVMVAAMRGNEIVLVEPEFSEPNRLKEVTELIGQAANRNILCLPIAGYSTDVLPDMGQFAYVLIDSGSHQDGLPMTEVKMLEDKMLPGGIIAFHDWKSQFSEVMDAYNYLLSTGKYDEVPIPWQQIVEAVNGENLEDGNVSWHHNELKNPCFLGALKRKK